MEESTQYKVITRLLAKRRLSGNTKVKVMYRPVDEAKKKVRKQAIAQTIMQALRRFKEHGK